MAVIYARQSKDRNGDGAAVDRQLEACRALAEAHGLSVTEELIDNDVSATTGDREAFLRLLDGVRDGRIDTVIVWATDRLYRRLRDLVQLVELAEQNNLRVLTVKSGDIDLTTPAGRMLAGMLGSAARFEVEQKGARQVAANAQRASRGEWQFTRRPYGYERRDGVVQIVPEEAEVIREGYLRSLAGESGYSIVADWNARGVLAPGGKQWSITQLRKRLDNAHYAGLVVHQGQVAGKGNHEALVSEEDWRSFALQSAARASRKVGDNRTKYLLSGLAICGVCGAVLFARPEYRRSGDRVMTYQCTTSWCVSRKLHDVDEFVESVVIARLSLPDAAALASPEIDTVPLMVESQALRGRLADLAALLADGLLDAAAVREQSVRLRARLDALETQIGAAARVPDIGRLAASQNAETTWANMSLASRRAVIAALLTVTVRKSKSTRIFDPEDVVIEWLTR